MKSIIDQAVDRFLGWKLPADFAPDAGITFKASYNETSPFGPSTHEPAGTNLFTADQAKAMFTHCIGDLLQQGEAQPAQKLWPFVESPSEFTERLRVAISQFRDLLPAVRNVLIENPAQVHSRVIDNVRGDLHDWRNSASYGGDICATCGVVKCTARAEKPCAYAQPSPLFTHPPAPKLVTVDDVTDEMVERFNSDVLRYAGNDDVIVAAVNAFTSLTLGASK